LFTSYCFLLTVTCLKSLLPEQTLNISKIASNPVYCATE
jgi:hypothetical protein